MPDPELLPPPAHEVPLLDEPAEERLGREVESLRHQLEEERQRNRKNNEEGKKEGPDRPRNRTLWLIALGIVVVLLAAFFLGYLPHRRREKQLKQDAQAAEKALPVVSYILAQRSLSDTALVLPGNVTAIMEAPVLARADGYVKKRYVDIGDRVKESQLLAEVSSPDLDRQVDQARAQLAQSRASQRQTIAALEQARANQALAKVTADRWAGLLRRGAVSPQDNDTRQADYKAQTANVVSLEESVSAATQNVAAAESNLNRLLELQSYEQVRAPFSGVITLRNVDEGALIGNGQTLLFRIAQTDRLRIYIYVPEAGAPLVQIGRKASLAVAEFPGRPFEGVITRTAEALDPATRTLLTEVQVANPRNTLSPGMFAEVTLNYSRPDPPVLIPADSLVVRPTGTFAATLEGDASTEDRKPDTDDSKEQGGGRGRGDKKSDKKTYKKSTGKDDKKDKKNDREEKADLEKQQQQLPTLTVHLIPVTIGRDYGNAIEILTGLHGGERIVESPNDQVQEKAQVKGEKAKQNPVIPAASTKKPSATNETLPPKPEAEPTPKEPAKERTNRGPA